MTISDKIRWDDNGLVPAIAQDSASGRVLMMAWMNQEALQCTLQEKRAVYWSRSRGQLWRKGESSGNVQHLKELSLDCDGDTLLMKVEQVGGIACHTGRQSCFFQVAENGDWLVKEPVLKDPKQMYGGGDDES